MLSHFSKTLRSFARAFSTPALLVKAARRGFPVGLMLMTKEKAADKVRLLGTRDVKGVALKTHEGPRPSTLQAFKKA